VGEGEVFLLHPDLWDGAPSSGESEGQRRRKESAKTCHPLYPFYVKTRKAGVGLLGQEREAGAGEKKVFRYSFSCNVFSV
jgi:hypothetical protein